VSVSRHCTRNLIACKTSAASPLNEGAYPLPKAIDFINPKPTNSIAAHAKFEAARHSNLAWDPIGSLPVRKGAAMLRDGGPSGVVDKSASSGLVVHDPLNA